MKSLLFICIYLFTSNVSYAKLQDYSCRNASDSPQCNKCYKDDSMFSDFKVNIDKNIIIKEFYVGNKLSGSASLENCRIVDKNNWICDSSKTSNIENTHSMTNGVYSWIFGDINHCSK
jgi:hypothetical protein